MAGTDEGRQFERRRFVTRHDVEDAAAAGRAIVLRGRDRLTDEASQRAMDLGVTVEREGGHRPGPAGAGRPGGAVPGPASATAPTAGSGAGSGAGSPSGSVAELRRAVRAAVIAELGSEPPGLDAVIDRVLRDRAR